MLLIFLPQTHLPSTSHPLAATCTSPLLEDLVALVDTATCSSSNSLHNISHLPALVRSLLTTLHKATLVYLIPVCPHRRPQFFTPQWMIKMLTPMPTSQVRLHSQFLNITVVVQRTTVVTPLLKEDNTTSSEMMWACPAKILWTTLSQDWLHLRDFEQICNQSIDVCDVVLYNIYWVYASKINNNYFKIKIYFYFNHFK